MDNITSTKELPVVNIVETLSLTLCYLVDFPVNFTDCSIQNPLKCVICTARGTYITGESINDYSSLSHLTEYFLWIITIIVSVIGLLGNLVIIKVFSKRKNCKSFDSLLLMLSGWDVFSCIMKILVSSASTAYFGNWFGRGKGTIDFYIASFYTSMFSRSGSAFMTILITIERYYMIAFPVKANIWFTAKNTKILALGVFLITLILNYPRFASLSVEPNNLRDIPSLQSLEYILRTTPHGKFWYGTLKAVHNQIDFWVPYPIILIFNSLSYWKVRQLSKRRMEMNLNQKQNIRAAKMFLPVGAIYFITNTIVSASYFTVHFMKISSRELITLGFLATAVNSSVNLPIYYYCNNAFKTEARAALREFKESIFSGGDKRSDGFMLCNSPNPKHKHNYGNESGVSVTQKSASSVV